MAWGGLFPDRRASETSSLPGKHQQQLLPRSTKERMPPTGLAPPDAWSTSAPPRATKPRTRRSQRRRCRPWLNFGVWFRVWASHRDWCAPMLYLLHGGAPGEGEGTRMGRTGARNDNAAIRATLAFRGRRMPHLSIL